MRVFNLCTFVRFETTISPSIRFDIILQGTAPEATCGGGLFLFRFSIAMQKKQLSVSANGLSFFFFSFPFFLFFFSKNAGFFFQGARGAIIGFTSPAYQTDATILLAIFSRVAQKYKRRRRYAQSQVPFAPFNPPPLPELLEARGLVVVDIFSQTAHFFLA